MEQTKGLSCQIPESLHARVTAERVAANQSLSEYITGLLTNYYENGGKKDMAQTRTMAFQISEDLFQRGYQANTRIVTVTDTMLEELVNMKR